VNLEELRARLLELDGELRSIHETAGDAALSDEQQTRWAELTTERSTVDGQVREIEGRREQVRSLSVVPGHTESTNPDPLGDTRSIHDNGQTRKIWDLDAVSRSLYESPEKGGSELRSRALDAVEKAPGLNDKTRQHVTKLLETFDMEDDEAEGRGARKMAAHVIATSSPEYMRAWSKAFKTGMRTGQPDIKALQVLQRAMSLTDASGGHAVPLPIDPTLILDDDGTVSPLRQLATVKTVVTDEYKTVNTGAVTASYDAEAAEVSDDATTFGNTNISVHMARAFIPHSIEIGMDYPGFTQDVAFLLQDSKMQLEDNKFAVGSGTAEPFGCVTAIQGTSFEITSNTTDVFALSDVYDLDEELPERFAKNASWLANKKIYTAIREAGGANLDDFWVDLRDGTPAQLLGHPKYEASEMDGVIDAAADNRALLLGDFKWFWIIDRIGFSMELVPHLFHTTTNRPSGQRGVFAYWRNGSDVVLNRAFRLLNVT
jgi:HK97 family phage major capsid protein